MDFEARLRETLARSADAAPRYEGQREQSPEPGPIDRPRRESRSGKVSGLLAAAAVVLIGGIVVTVVQLGSPDRPEAQCPTVLDFNGNRYAGSGDLQRVPRAGASLGSATTPGCSDQNGDAQAAEREVLKVPGVSAQDALLSNSELYVAEDLTEWPEGLRKARQPLACPKDAGELGGFWVSLEGPMPERDGQVTTPYVAVLSVDGGTGLPLDQWSEFIVRLQINEATAGATDPRLVTEALQEGARVEATVTCDGTAFVAEDFRLAEQ